MGKRKQKSDKSLGRDPFENMEEMGREETSLPATSTGSEIETEAEQADAEVEPPVEVETVEAEPVPPVVEPAAEVEESQATEPTDEPLSASPVDEGDERGREVVAELDEEASHLLDELIDTIDQEIEEAFGPGAMTELATVAPTGQEGGQDQHVILGLAGSEYAVLAANVREIGEPPNVTPVPNVPDWVLGVANLRGDIISVVDLRLFLGMERIDYNDDTRMMVIHTERNASSVTTGLIVDMVSDIRYLSVNRISVPTAPIEGRVAPYLRGIYEHEEHLLVVLDFDKLLLSPEMQQFQPV